MSFPQSFFEISFEIAAIDPIIFPITVWLPSRVFSFIQISICKFLGSLTVFKAVPEISLVSVSVDPDMDTIAVSLSHFPFSEIAVSFGALPHSRPVFESIEPLSLIEFSVGPEIFADSFWFSIAIVPLVSRAIGECLIAVSMFIIIFPVSFIDPIVIVHHDSLPVPFAIHDLAVIG
jgi:hypothetical protein